MIAMKMPKYEKIRNQRSRQAPVKSSRLWTFINSAFFLWLLSAVILSIGGAYFNQHLACITSAETDGLFYSHLTEEIFDRQARVISALTTTSNPIDFSKVVDSKSFVTFKEFDGQNFKSLLKQKGNMWHKIKNIDEADDRELAIRKNYFDRVLFYNKNPFLGDHVSDQDLALYRQKAPKFAEMLNYVRREMVYWEVRPNCSVTAFLREAFGKFPQHLVALDIRKYPPDF
jgi:hypothetical protein